MKVDLDLVKICLQRASLDVRQVASILEEINQEVAAMLDDEHEPSVKKQFVVLLPATTVDTAHILQIAESESASIAESGIVAATREFNATPKGRRLPIKTIAEACEHVPARFFKEHGVWVKTKEPVYTVRVQGRI